MNEAVESTLRDLEKWIAAKRGVPSVEPDTLASLLHACGGEEHVVAVLLNYQECIQQMPTTGRHVDSLRNAITSVLSLMPPEQDRKGKKVIVESDEEEEVLVVKQPEKQLHDGEQALDKTAAEEVEGESDVELQQQQSLLPAGGSEVAGGEAPVESDVQLSDTVSKKKSKVVKWQDGKGKPIAEWEPKERKQWFFYSLDFPDQHWTGEDGLLAQVGLQWQMFHPYVSVLNSLNMRFPPDTASSDYEFEDIEVLKGVDEMARKAALSLNFLSHSGKSTVENVLGPQWNEWYQRIRKSKDLGWVKRIDWTASMWMGFYFFTRLFKYGKLARDADKSKKKRPVSGGTAAGASKRLAKRQASSE